MVKPGAAQQATLPQPVGVAQSLRPTEAGSPGGDPLGKAPGGEASGGKELKMFVETTVKMAKNCT